MTDQKKSWLSNILTSIITSLAVLAGAWFAFQGDTDNADAKRLESAFQRIEYLETEMRQQQANSNTKIIELTSQVFRLQSQLDKDLNIVDMFEQFMDSLPFEAWLKDVHLTEKGVTEFRMLLINKRYEFNYGVSRSRYEGETDDQIWGDEIAQAFRENDLKVLATKSSLVTYETYPSRVYNGFQTTKGTVTKMVVKVYLELIDGRQMIFGMAIDMPQK